MQLDPVGAHEGNEERVQGKRQTPVDMVDEADPLEARWGREGLGNERTR